MGFAGAIFFQNGLYNAEIAESVAEKARLKVVAQRGCFLVLVRKYDNQPQLMQLFLEDLQFLQRILICRKQYYGDIIRRLAEPLA